MYILCRQGNDSQRAVQLLREQFGIKTKDQSSTEDTGSLADGEQDIPAEEKSYNVVFKDIAGGLHSWAKHIDKDFPVY